jgi:hypothetical protein
MQKRPRIVADGVSNNGFGNFAQWIYVYIRQRTVKPQFRKNNQRHPLQMSTILPSFLVQFLAQCAHFKAPEGIFFLIKRIHSLVKCGLWGIPLFIFA